MKKAEKVLMKCNSGDDSFSYRRKKGNLVMIGSGEHATFVRVGKHETLDQKVDRICDRIEHESKVQQRKDCINLKKRLENLKTQVVLFKLRQIIIEEMRKDYYQNAGNIQKFIDIDTHLVKDSSGNEEYWHVENLCIWQNGFYNFNSFNMTIPGMSGRRKYANFNEEMAEELKKLESHGQIVEIPMEDKGTPEDYEKLEAKILSRCKEHESYTK